MFLKTRLCCFVYDLETNGFGRSLTESSVYFKILRFINGTLSSSNWPINSGKENCYLQTANFIFANTTPSLLKES